MITVLLVEDHPAMRKALRILIEEKSGYKVIESEANSGYEAIDIVKKKKPAVSLL